MTIRFLIYIIIIFSITTACANKQSTKTEQSPAQKLLQRIEAAKGQGILFGHQDDLAYGMTWAYEEGNSDVKLVGGDYPAIAGWELGGIELDHTHNLDSVPFDYMRKMTIWAHKKGIINTMSWHPFSAVDSCSSWDKEKEIVPHIIPGGKNHQDYIVHLDKLAAFFASLKTEEGALVPIIFRPFHEMDGTWFWWGKHICTPEDFKMLFRFTVNYLREEKGLKNLLIAYSPDRKYQGVKGYLTWYPGDDVVDILGMDNYYGFKTDTPVETVTRELSVVVDVALEKGKPVALTETGQSNLKDSLWLTTKLLPVLKTPHIKENLSYVMVWRSDPKVHFYFSYPGHKSEPDAKVFLANPYIWLLNDINKLDNKK